MLESASRHRVRKIAEKILAGGTFDNPEVTILCTGEPSSIRCLGAIPGIRLITLPSRNKGRIVRDLSNSGFDVLYAFWTGEKSHRGMKLRALRIKAKDTYIDIGDGSVFRLTWKAILRHWIFRRAHPLPTDHWEFLPQSEPSEAPEGPEDREKAGFVQTGPARSSGGQKVLLVQSADPKYVLAALEVLKDGRILRNPCYTLFCRNRPEIIRHFRNHPLIREIRTHSEARGSLKHLRSLRREGFEVVVVFFTGDPSYWKVKYFAFLLGIHHKLIFNENNHCFFFNLRNWVRLLSYRMEVRARIGAGPRHASRLSKVLFLSLKVLLIPFRFAWLLLVWLRLRAAARLAPD